MKFFEKFLVLISPKGDRIALSYFLAVSLVLLIVIAQQSMAHLFGNEPMLMIFILPVIICAILGGFWPGFVATLLAAVVSCYFFIQPVKSFNISSAADLLQFLFFITSGLLISLLSESLHRSTKARLLKRQKLEDLKDELNFVENRFKAVFDRAASGLALVDTEGHWLKVNGTLCDFFGFSEEELLTKNFQEITYPDDLKKDLDQMQKVLAGEIDTYAMEKRYIHKNGGILWALLTVSLVRDDGIPSYFISVVEDIQYLKATEAALLENEAALKQAQELAKMGKWEWDVVEGVHTWSDEVYNIYERDKSLGPVLYPEVGNYFTADSWSRLSAAVENALKEGTPYTCDAEIVRNDRSNRWVVVIGDVKQDINGKVVYLYGTIQDITERKIVEQKLQLWGDTFKNAGFALSISDATKNTFLAVNPTFAEQRGYTIEELVGKPVLTIFPTEVHEEVKRNIKEIDDAGHGIRESVHIRKDGSTFPVVIDLTVTKSPFGKVVSRLAYVMDLSERKKSEAIIHQLANFDTLTRLPNRRLLNERIKHLLELPAHEKNEDSLILINLDHFQAINDARGHTFGDNLLILVANRLSELLTENDMLARFGGNDFAIILHPNNDSNTDTEKLIANLITRISESMQIPFYLDENEEVYITTSVGVTLFPESNIDNIEQIIKRADTALLGAKRGGGAQVVFFKSEMGELLENYFNINRELHSAVSSNQMRLYLQPQFDSSRKLVGAEALVRWQHPSRGLISPVEFISVAEESDFIIEIDDWVLNQVCQILKKLELMGIKIRISVNISPRHFKKAEFVDWVIETLLTHNIKASQITFEVTENLIIDDIEKVVAKMKVLTNMGIRISIDDFGTGYSSLSYLKKLPIQELKIDKIFIQDATSDADDAVLVETILAVARQMKLDVVAEGVETVEQVAFLSQRGQVIYQGYLYGKPVLAKNWLAGLKHKQSIRI